LDVPAVLAWTVLARHHPPVGILIDPEWGTHGNIYVSANTAAGRMPRSVPLKEQPRRWGADAVHQSCSARKSIRMAPASGRHSGLGPEVPDIAARRGNPGVGSEGPVEGIVGV